MVAANGYRRYSVQDCGRLVALSTAEATSVHCTMLAAQEADASMLFVVIIIGVKKDELSLTDEMINKWKVFDFSVEVSL